MIRKYLKKTRFIVIFLIILLMLSITTKVRASDVTADSCSRNDVQSAISQVQNAGGGTVYIPAGDCNWDGKGSSGTPIQGKVSIIGAGVGKTILRVTDRSTFFYYSGKGDSTFFRLSGITFYSDLGCTSSCKPSIGIQIRKTENFRIDHTHFEGYFGPVIQWKSVPKGLIDHSTFVNHNISNSGSYYGISGGMPYDGGPPNPIKKVPPVGLPICDTDSTYGCSCEVGEPSKNRASSVAEGKTAISSVAALIDKGATSGTGKVRRIYVNIAVAGPAATINVASFSRSGNNFTARARTKNLAVKPGLNIFSVDDNEFSAIDIHDSDYLGVYLNDCSLEAATGTTGWTVSGDQTNQSSVDFGSPNIGSVSLYAELYDDDNVFATCEQNWVNWYNDKTRGGGFYQGFERNWDYDENAIYFEDNTFTWFKSAVNSNWGGSAKLVIRYNTFYSENGLLITWIKPGNNFAIWHDNQFENTESSPHGYVSWINTDALFYNNNLKNFGSGGSYEFYRHFSDYYYPFFVRPKEVFIWNNTYENCKCGTTDEDCWYSATAGAYWMNQPGENGTIRFKAPQPGDRLYELKQYPYPHPLASGKGKMGGNPSPPTSLRIIGQLMN